MKNPTNNKRFGKPVQVALATMLLVGLALVLATRNQVPDRDSHDPDDSFDSQLANMPAGIEPDSTLASHTGGGSQQQPRATAWGSSLTAKATTVKSSLARIENGRAFDPVELYQLLENETGETGERSTRLVILADIARTLIRVDPVAAATMVDVMPEFSDRIYFSRVASDSLVKESPELALAWARNLSDPALKAPLFRVLGESWAQSDLAAAIAWAEANMSNPKAAEFVEGIAADWSKKDPIGLQQWLGRTGQPEAHQAIVKAKLAKIESVDAPRRAIEAALELPPSAQRTSALLFGLSTWSSADREGAIQWVNELHDPKLRAVSRLSVAVSLIESDPDTADAWITSWEDRDAEKEVAFGRLADHRRKAEAARTATRGDSATE